MLIRPSPRDIGLNREEWRPHQFEACESIAETKKRVVVVEGPTGTGKSYIAAGTTKLTGSKAFILTANHSLQDQYVDEGIGEKVIGRANYPCILPSAMPDQAEEFGVTKNTTVDIAPCASGFDCPVRSECPYFVDVARAMKAQISVHNYHYWLPESTHVKRFTGADLLWADEGHLLDDTLCEFSTVNLPDGLLQLMERKGLDLPDKGIENVDTWVEYGKMASRVAMMAATDHLPGTVERAKWKKRVSLFDSLSNLSKDGSWVVTPSGIGIKVEPVWPVDTLEILLGTGGNKKAKKLVIMSATILNLGMFSDVLGINQDEIEFIKLPWVFPPDSRPIYYRPVASVTKETSGAAAKPLAMTIDGIIDRRVGEKGIIHTHSFDLLNKIYANLSCKDRIIPHFRGMNRAELIKEFKEHRGDKWLMSPSVTHGEDFSYDVARCQVIVKMPFPDQGNKVTRMRMNQKPWWYKYQTAKVVIQQIGRVTRAADDYGETFILDSKFDSLLTIMPKEIKEAMR